MYLPEFDYFSPQTLVEALAILDEKREEAYPLAGGTDLLPLMKEGRLHPSLILSLRKIDKLTQVDQCENSCIIGSCVTVAALGESLLAQNNPAFLDAVNQMATPQIRNRATVGGNLCTASPCADFPPVLLVSRARVRLAGRHAERELPLLELFKAPRETARKGDELLTEIICELSNRGSAYVKLGVRGAGNIAIVGAAASIKLEGELISDIRVAVTAASPIPVLLEGESTGSLGEPPSSETFDNAASRLALRLIPISDLRGSAEYRMHLAKVAAKNALALAHDRWRGKDCA